MAFMSKGDYSYSADNKASAGGSNETSSAATYNSTAVYPSYSINDSDGSASYNSQYNFMAYTPVGYLTPQPGSEDYRASSGAERTYDPTWESTGGSWNKYTDTTRVDGAPAANTFYPSNNAPSSTSYIPPPNPQNYTSSTSSGAFPPDLGPTFIADNGRMQRIIPHYAGDSNAERTSSLRFPSSEYSGRDEPPMNTIPVPTNHADSGSLLVSDPREPITYNGTAYWRSSPRVSDLDESTRLVDDHRPAEPVYVHTSNNPSWEFGSWAPSMHTPNRAVSPPLSPERYDASTYNLSSRDRLYMTPREVSLSPYPYNEPSSDSLSLPAPNYPQTSNYPPTPGSHVPSPYYNYSDHYPTLDTLHLSMPTPDYPAHVSDYPSSPRLPPIYSYSDTNHYPSRSSTPVPSYPSNY